MMKSYGLFGFLGFICLPFVLALPARAEVTPRVFISEINWAGSQVSTADEWIELVNLGSTPIDLSGFVLTGTATSGGAIAIAEGTTLEPGSTLLIANYALGDPKTSLLTSPTLVTTALSLPNSGLNILLTTPEGLVLDSYTDTGTPDFGLANPATSIERDLTTLLWKSSTQNLNLSSTSQLGTPGGVSLPLVTLELPLSLPTPEPTPIEPEPMVDLAPAPEAPIVTPSPEVIEQLPVPVETVTSNTDVVLEIPVPVVLEPIPEPIVTIEQTTPGLEPVITATETSTTPDVPEITISNTPSVQKITPGDLVLNELVSDPLDGVEWLEILNAGSATLNLSGSTLTDAGAHLTSLPDLELSAGAYLVIENPNGNLNNTTETLTLTDAYGTTLDTLTYGTAEIPAPEDGESLARNSDDVWLVTMATRNYANDFPTPHAPIDDLPPWAGPSPAPTAIDYDSLPTDPYDTTTNTLDSPLIDSGTTAGPVASSDDLGTPPAEPVHRIVAIAKSLNVAGQSPATARKGTSKKSSAQIVVTGTVVALPGTFGKQILYLDGREIYFHAADWPTLALGDVVQVTGTEAVSDGVTRIKISTAEAIVITGQATLTPAPIDGSELATTAHGSLVSMSGRVVGKNGNQLSVITDDNVTITVLGNKRTGVSWSSMQSGNIIVTGLVRFTSDGPVISPRSKDDVHHTPDGTAPLAAPVKPKTKATPIVGGGLLTGSIGALGTWYLRSRKGLLSWLPI